jgi:hypothetical protein
VTGLVAQRRQRPRRRITPNTNTSTTTMISTHNHVDMAASLVGAGAIQADATAAHLGKQLGRSPGSLAVACSNAAASPGSCSRELLPIALDTAQTAACESEGVCRDLGGPASSLAGRRHQPEGRRYDCCPQFGFRGYYARQ